MSQWDILSALEHDKTRYFTRLELAENLKKSPSEISSCLRRLRLGGFVDVNLFNDRTVFKYREARR